MRRTAAPPAASRRVLVGNWLQEGLRLHQGGRVAEAAALYDKVLRQEPSLPDALNLRGVAAIDLGDPARGAAWLDRAIRAAPKVADYHVHRGNAALALGDLEGALAAYGRAVALDARSVTAHANAGHVLLLLGRPDEAVSRLERALALAPNFAPAHVNMGIVALERGDLDGAERHLRRALAIDPTAALAHFNLGVLHHRREEWEPAIAAFGRAVALNPRLPGAAKNLALALRRVGRIEEAVEVYRAALELDPNDADHQTDLAVGLAKLGRIEEALTAVERAVALAPNDAGHWLNRAFVLRGADRLSEAEAALERAAELAPESVQVWSSLGDLYAERGDRERAIDIHRRAIACDPEYPDAHWNLSLALLGAGRWAEGWDEYEWRWRASSATAGTRTVGAPRWQGEPLQGKRLAVWREQGLGDELLFATCLPDLTEAGATVTFIANPRLLSLLARTYPEVRLLPDPALSGQVLPLDTVGPADLETPLGSLPRWLRRRLRDFPAANRPLAPDPVGRDLWWQRLGALGPGLKVGICWRSGSLTPERARHYSRLDAWGPIFALSQVFWINLQYDDCAAELRSAEEQFGVSIHRWDDLDLRNDLEGVVALMSSLDAVITAPTAVSSFAGALGVPTWQLDSGSDWTVGGADRSPWFPSIEVVRRDERGFSGAIERVAASLAHRLSAGTGEETV